MSVSVHPEDNQGLPGTIIQVSTSRPHEVTPYACVGLTIGHGIPAKHHNFSCSGSYSKVFVPIVQKAHDRYGIETEDRFEGIEESKESADELLIAPQT